MTERLSTHALDAVIHKHLVKSWAGKVEVILKENAQ